MARIARLVVPFTPHHVTQRGNRRQKTFFCREDYYEYIRLLADAKEKTGVHIWAYCLMPNHVHLVVVPDDSTSLANLFREVHQRYSRLINNRFGWRGHLWQERFHSTAMDASHTRAAVRYVELNPIRANLCQHPEEWPFSSACAHLSGIDDRLVEVAPMLDQVADWRSFITAEHSPRLNEIIRQHGRTGRPMGNDQFIERLECLTGRTLKPAKRGPKRKIRE